MIEINLIPDVKQELIRAQRMRTTVISTSILVSIISVGVVIALLLYVFGAQLVRKSILDGAIKDGSAKLSKVEDLSKMLTIQNQLTKISELNKQKNIDSRTFDMLQAVTPVDDNKQPMIRISQVDVANTSNAETGGSPRITIQGQTATYSSMEVFKKTVDSAIVEYNDNGEMKSAKLASNIGTSDVSYGADAENNKVVRFTLSFSFAPELFSSEVTAPVIKLSVNGNVTDSYLGIPKSIFTERAKDL